MTDQNFRPAIIACIPKPNQTVCNWIDNSRAETILVKSSTECKIIRNDPPVLPYGMRQLQIQIQEQEKG